MTIDTGINEESKKKIMALISALLPEAEIYLFGSRARGTHLKWSDIDIALNIGKKISSSTTGELMSIFEATNMPYKIQIVDFNSVSEKMRENITNERVIWKK